MIEKRIICISGFLQKLWTPNGMEKLWMRIREQEDSSCCVSLLPWNSNWRGFVQHIIRTSPVYFKSLDIRVAAYSWGCGYGFIKFANELRKWGIPIKTAVFSDPVYHNSWMLWRSLWSPILGQPKIYVPDNVREVYYFRQRESTPSGCQCIARDYDATRIVDCGYLYTNHIWMDDAVAFHKLAIEKLS